MTVNNWDDSKILTKKDTSIDPKKKGKHQNNFCLDGKIQDDTQLNRRSGRQELSRKKKMADMIAIGFFWIS